MTDVGTAILVVLAAAIVPIAIIAGLVSWFFKEMSYEEKIRWKDKK